MLRLLLPVLIIALVLLFGWVCAELMKSKTGQDGEKQRRANLVMLKAHLLDEVNSFVLDADSKKERIPLGLLEARKAVDEAVSTARLEVALEDLAKELGEAKKRR